MFTLTWPTMAVSRLETRFVSGQLVKHDLFLIVMFSCSFAA